MDNLIDWDTVNMNLNEMRRSVGQLAIANRNSNQPAAKRRRVESPEPEEGDVTLCSDRLPPLDPQSDTLNDPARFLVDAAHAKVCLIHVVLFLFRSLLALSLRWPNSLTTFYSFRIVMV